jgi:hypothetical protein
VDLIVERNFSELLRASGEVLKEAEHRDVLLRRRDGADMMLVEAEREAGVREALAMSIQILGATVIQKVGASDLLERLPDIAPWTNFLPTDDRERFLVEFLRTSMACADMKGYEPLAQMLREWKATAAIWADPHLLAELRAPFGPTEERTLVPRP